MSMEEKITEEKGKNEDPMSILKEKMFGFVK